MIKKRKKINKKNVVKEGDIKSPSTTKKVASMQERMSVFDGDILGDEYDKDYLKSNKLYERTVKRKARYWCYKHMHAAIENKKTPNSPEGFKEFIEKLPGFAGWENFAKTWDIHGNNPFMIILRLRSVWTEWDYVMDRVAIPVDAAPNQINARMELLAKEYAKN